MKFLIFGQGLMFRHRNCSRLSARAASARALMRAEKNGMSVRTEADNCIGKSRGCMFRPAIAVACRERPVRNRALR